MAQIGTNVGFPPTQADLGLLDRTPGLHVVRWAPRGGNDDSWFLSQVRDRGLRPWLVIDGGAYAPLETLVKRYPGKDIIWQVGNEPDIDSPSSWTMDQQRFSAILARGRQLVGPDVFLVAGGLASGNPDWLDGVDLGPVDSIAFHPYGKWPTSSPPAGGWGFGPVLELVSAYRNKLLNGPWPWMHMSVSEYGAPSAELGGAWAGYEVAMTGVLQRESGLDWAIQFCLSDNAVDGFGLYDRNGAPKVDLGLAPLVPPAPKFVLGFLDWARSDPDLIGEPLENEWGAVPNISQQRTTHGLLTWASLVSGQVMTFLDIRDGGRWLYQNGRSVPA